MMQCGPEPRQPAAQWRNVHARLQYPALLHLASPIHHLMLLPHSATEIAVVPKAAPFGAHQLSLSDVSQEDLLQRELQKESCHWLHHGKISSRLRAPESLRPYRLSDIDSSHRGYSVVQAPTPSAHNRLEHCLRV